MFRVGNSAYGTEGSIGMILIFSILGSIFHFIMANYIYAMNPGKYGVKKSPFYFLKVLVYILNLDLQLDKCEINISICISLPVFEKIKCSA